MNLLSKVTAVGAVVLTAGVMSVSAAQALTVEQSQELTHTAKTSITCTGECSGTAEVTQNAKQSQKVVIPTVKSTKHIKNKNLKALWVPSTVVMLNDGQVRLNWGMRGGTCHVRYTEAKSSVWNYSTAAGCDEAGVTINGLKTGVNYKFQVRQNDGAWSRVMVGKAQ